MKSKLKIAFVHIFALLLFRNAFQTLSPGENNASSADELYPHRRKFQHVRVTLLLATLLMLAFHLSLLETMMYLKTITESLGKNKYCQRAGSGSRGQFCFPNSRK